MDFLKSIAGKIVAGLVAVGVLAAGVSWWQMDLATRDALIKSTGKILAWIGIVGVLPFVTFFVTRAVAKFENNVLASVMVIGYTLLEFLLLLWLFDWSIEGTLAWAFVGLGVLTAALYNLLACDWLAEKFD